MPDLLSVPASLIQEEKEQAEQNRKEQEQADRRREEELQQLMAEEEEREREEERIRREREEEVARVAEEERRREEASRALELEQQRREQEKEFRRKEAERLEQEQQQERQAQERKETVKCFCQRHGFASATESRRGGCGVLGSSVKYPLHQAAELADSRIVEMLLKEGASPMMKNGSRQTTAQVAQKMNKSGSHDAVLQALKTAATGGA